MNVYSPWKFAHHRDLIDKLRAGEIIPPLQCQIDLWGGCNHQCKYCFYRIGWKDGRVNSSFRPQLHLDTDLVCRFIEDFKRLGGKAVEITGGGESTLHPGIVDIAKFIRAQGLELALVTNGSRVTDELVAAVDFASWIRVSLDASCSDTYNEVHGVRRGFDEVLEATRRFVAGCPDSINGISFVINPANWPEIVEATQLAKGTGVNNIRFSLAYTDEYDKLHESYWSEASRLLTRAKKLESPSFKVFSFKERMDDLSLKTRDFDQCFYQQTIVVVGNDGGVYPCCTLKYNSSVVLGSLHEKSLEEIWYGERRRKFLAAGAKVCKDVPCWMASKNSYIEYLVMSDPPHVNFI